MADVNDILTDLRSELVGIVLRVVPNEKGNGEASFEYIPPTKSTIEETTGRTRAFQISLSEIVPKWAGNTAHRYDCTLDLKIGYPRNDWEIAAASDFAQIRSAINVSGGSSSATGVAFRTIHTPEKGAAKSFSLLKTNDWMYSVITINAVIATA